jgi:hypothetical protein
MSRRIVANAAPTATFVVTCAAGICTYDASGSADTDGTIAFYEWTFGDGAALSLPSGSATTTHSYRTGMFTVQLVVRDNGGASATASATVETVNHPPVASFDHTCDSLRCTFDASTSADPEGRALRYSWWTNSGNGTVFNGTAITQHTYGAPGTFLVLLTVADDAGQMATVERTIGVQPGAMHVGDLDGTSTQGAKGSSIARVTVVVHDRNHQRVASAYVSGRWSSGEGSGCTTDGTGQCTMSTALKGTGGTLTIRTVEHVAFVYQGPNHDPDADSDGTTITLKKR